MTLCTWVWWKIPRHSVHRSKIVPIWCSLLYLVRSMRPIHLAAYENPICNALYRVRHQLLYESPFGCRFHPHQRHYKWLADILDWVGHSTVQNQWKITTKNLSAAEHMEGEEQSRSEQDRAKAEKISHPPLWRIGADVQSTKYNMYRSHVRHQVPRIQLWKCILLLEIIHCIRWGRFESWKFIIPVSVRCEIVGYFEYTHSPHTLK